MKLSLGERWGAIFIKFEGVFYEGDNYTKRYLHVIDDVILNEKKGSCI